MNWTAIRDYWAKGPGSRSIVWRGRKRHEVPAQEPPVDEPPYPDPLDEETRPPEDADICGPCVGTGEVFERRDWETGGVDTKVCPVCKGSGVLEFV